MRRNPTKSADWTRPTSAFAHPNCSDMAMADTDRVILAMSDSADATHASPTSTTMPSSNPATPGPGPASRHASASSASMTGLPDTSGGYRLLEMRMPPPWRCRLADADGDDDDVLLLLLLLPVPVLTPLPATTPLPPATPSSLPRRALLRPTPSLLRVGIIIPMPRASSSASPNRHPRPRPRPRPGTCRTSCRSTTCTLQWFQRLCFAPSSRISEQRA
mmetsp:Transcript_11222/g.28395  ORF Transcript_11222/g.28395 Transcript_11222/m.28395 type:complete len:218 (-) Transcript_11222:1163-1816(-)